MGCILPEAQKSEDGEAGAHHSAPASLNTHEWGKRHTRFGSKSHLFALAFKMNASRITRMHPTDTAPPQINQAGR